MTARDWLLFVVRASGFALVTAMGGWVAVPLTAAVWSTLATAERRRELRIALAAAASWALLLGWSADGAATGRLLSLLGGIFRVPGWTLIVLTLAIPALLAWGAAVVASDVSAAIAAHAARRENR